MHDTAYMERRRVRLSHHEAPALTTALVTGSPVVTTRGWDEQAAEFAVRLNDQWFVPRNPRFAALSPSGSSRDELYNVDALLSGDGPFYGELFTISNGGTKHMHACVRDKRPDRDTFAFSSVTSPFYVHATTRARDSYTTSSWKRGHSPSASVLGSFILDARPARPSLPPVDPALFLRVFDVVTEAGPALDDPVWWSPIPEPGTDIAFDHEFPIGVWGHYVLHRKQNLEK